MSVFHSGFALGLVVSKKTDKTVKVAIRRKVIHKKYKIVRYSKSYLLAHDELNESVPGDQVLIKQCRPMSKLKRHIIHDIAVKYKPAAFLEEHPELRPSEDKDHQYLDNISTSTTSSKSYKGIKQKIKQQGQKI